MNRLASRSRGGVVVAAVLGLLLTDVPPLGAHEFWLAVPAGGAAIGQPVRFEAGAGERFLTPDRALEVADIQVQVIAPSGAVTPATASAERGGIVTGAFIPTESGIYTIAAALRSKPVSYSAPDFQGYLTTEHLNAALVFRRALGEEDQPVREAQTMFAKTFVRIGGDQTVGASAPRVGTKIELIPVGDPTALRSGTTLHVRLLFNNGKVSDAPVTATKTSQPPGEPYIARGRTNSLGEVDFTLTQPGVWLIRAVQMLPRTARAGLPGEWESYWASLTISVADR